MTLFHLIVLVVGASLVLFFVNRIFSLDTKMRQIVNVLVTTIVGVIALVWLLTWLGLDTGFHAQRRIGSARVPNPATFIA